jgi:threonine dehydrogenase-like Zn-dependent dehydrogenase
MKAIAITPGTTDLQIIEQEEPAITSANQVKLKVLQVGICGTDREEVEGGRADAPPGHNHLVIGHEMFGQVVEVGSDVRNARPGDYGLFTVRRGCGKCQPCLSNRNDMCLTGDYTERGIKEHDGFQAEYVMDSETYFIQVPKEIASVGVLTEPLSISEKAIDEALKIQAARFPFTKPDELLSGKTVLVAGIGAVGILCAIALRLRGARVLGLDVVPADSLRPTLLREIGGEYINGRELSTLNIDDAYGQIDFIFEAAGIPQLQFELIDALGVNGLYVLTGIPADQRQTCVMGAELIQQMVLKNQVLLGCVNASIAHYHMAVETLHRAKQAWGDLIDRVITERYDHTNIRKALHNFGTQEIKTVVTW